MKKFLLVLAGVLLYVAPSWASCSNTQFGNFKCIVSTSAFSSDNSSITTIGIDTTGADLIVVVVTTDKGSGAPAISDSKVNTSCWSGLTAHSGSATFGQTRIFYCQSPIVGSSHTFTVNIASSFPCIAVAALSGSGLTPFDVQDGNGATGNVTSQLAGATGITPGSANELIVTGTSIDDDSGGGVSVDSGFTKVEESAGGVAGFGCSMGLFGQGSAAAVNPTWSFGAMNVPATSIASFKPKSTSISRHGQCSATATSCTLSAVATNDLVVIFAFRSGSATIPTSPGSNTAVTTVATSTGGTPASARIECRLGANFNDTGTGAFTNATSVAAVSYTGTRYTSSANCVTDIITKFATGQAKASTTASYTTTGSFSGTSGSWVVAFDGGTGSSHCAPTSPQTLTQFTSTGTVAGKDSNSVFTSWATETCAVSSEAWATFVAEVQNQQGSTRTLTDSPTSGPYAAREFSSRIAGLVRNPSDTLSVAADLSGRVVSSNRSYTETLFDSSMVGESSSRLLSAIRQASDSSSRATDFSSRLYASIRSSSDTLSYPSDISARLMSAIRAAGEMMVDDEVMARVFTGFRSATENSKSADGAARILAAVRPVSDNVQLPFDRGSRLLGAIRTGVESNAALEAGQRLLAAARSSSDSIFTPAEKSSRLLAAFRLANDYSGANDQGNRLVSNTRTSTDSVLKSDLSGRTLNSSRQFTELLFDSLLTGESAARQLVMTRSVNDSVKGFDTATRLGAFGRSIVEAAGVVESSARSVGFTRGIYDTLIMLDNPTVSQGTIVISVDGNHRFTLAARNTLFSAIAKNYSFAMSVRPTSFNLNQRAVTFRLSPRITEFIYLGRQ